MKTLMTKSLFILLRIRNISHKSYMENPNTHFMFYNFFFKENRAVYDAMSKTVVEPERPQVTI